VPAAIVSGTVTDELSVPAWLAVLAALAVLVLLLAVVGLVVSVRRARTRTERLLTSAAADAEELRSQLVLIEERLAAQEPPAAVAARPDDPEYVITALGRPREPAPTVPAPVFADIVVRESVIRTLSLAAGLRRALAPEVRNRIRFEMKREVRRARKQRKADLKQARREFEARQRATMGDPGASVSRGEPVRSTA
jgi:hypothetical protein